MPTAEGEEAAGDHVGGHVGGHSEAVPGEDHADEDGDYFATEHLRTRLADHHDDQGLVDQELVGLGRARDCEGRRAQPDPDFVTVLVVVGLEGLDHVVDHCSHYVDMAQLRGNHLVHLGYHLYPL